MKTAAQHLWEMVLLHEWGGGGALIQTKGQGMSELQRAALVLLLSWPGKER